jgi:hypothetical protein
MGQIVPGDNLFEITSFHMANFGQYIIYAALLFGVGWVMYLFSAPTTLAVFEEDDLEDLLEDFDLGEDEEVEEEA